MSVACQGRVPPNSCRGCALPRHEALGIGGRVALYEALAYIVFHYEDGASSILELPIQLADPEEESRAPSVLGFSALAQVVLHIDGPARSIALDAPAVRLP